MFDIHVVFSNTPGRFHHLAPCSARMALGWKAVAFLQRRTRATRIFLLKRVPKHISYCLTPVSMSESSKNR